MDDGKNFLKKMLEGQAQEPSAFSLRVTSVKVMTVPAYPSPSPDCRLCGNTAPETDERGPKRSEPARPRAGFLCTGLRRDWNAKRKAPSVKDRASRSDLDQFSCIFQKLS